LHRSAALALGLAAALGGCRSASRSGSPAGDPVASLGRDVRFLASDALEGRATGTAGNDSAAAYIARRFRELGLRQVVVDTFASACDVDAVSGADGRPCPMAWLQRFPVRGLAAVHLGRSGQVWGNNVIAALPGRDPALAREWIVVGAHFDHLGRASFGALDPQAANAIRNGADDNASGTATVLELARRFARAPARRSILFVAFGGEELGLIGSQFLVQHAPVPIDSVVAMLNFDMVGRLRDTLIVYGVATASELPALVDSAAMGETMRVIAQGDGFGPSDHSSFYAAGVPVLHFFTNLHEDYHRATDDADKLNVPGMARIATVAERVLRTIGDRPARLSPVRAAPPPAITGNSSRAWLGSVPDMASSDTSGLRLGGITPGSPADRAGLRAGDVVTELAGSAVRDLYDYSNALYAHRPGDVVKLVVLRDGKPMTFEVTLGARQ